MKDYKVELCKAFLQQAKSAKDRDWLFKKIEDFLDKEAATLKAIGRVSGDIYNASNQLANRLYSICESLEKCRAAVHWIRLNADTHRYSDCPVQIEEDGLHQLCLEFGIDFPEIELRQMQLNEPYHEPSMNAGSVISTGFPVGISGV